MAEEVEVMEGGEGGGESGINSNGDTPDFSSLLAPIKEKALAKGQRKPQPKKKPDVRALSKLSLPLTLNQYFGQYIPNIQNCLIFLERFVGDDETVAKVVKTWRKVNKTSHLSDSIDLDKLASESGISKGEFRRMIINALDLLGDEEAMMLLRLNKTNLIMKSIEVALNDDDPHNYEERGKLLEFYGFRLIPKGAQVSVSIDKSTNVSNSNNSATQLNIGLPSFSSAVAANEKVVAEAMREVIEEGTYIEVEASEVEDGGEGVGDGGGVKALPEPSSFLTLAQTEGVELKNG